VRGLLHGQCGRCGQCVIYTGPVLAVEIASVQVLLLDHIDPTSLRFGLGTFFEPDSVHAQRSHEICNVVCSVIWRIVSDKRAVLVSCDGW